ncbi:MAG: hypothetical protein COV57_01880 [Candidatus Liptonbacteria bacterium CG11_big_fil_rev_8_21_14_0_20_35_14]|uniref:dolichyl-phosphate beta-glucosyltransferase n=1 Tax=Candidatus Liptonbacteria bacterium CG11_big_fil_rev_8_21_14_0_20_35_14 TaxID=1974634 RepID=A0A2H0N7N7_9BACT|nr:MAG: hypothetical protein COV57_01880 [Candidatus Liptonbacteria bacterium CG11_big_fil_rev_8_21_14_0_20_35_14]
MVATKKEILPKKGGTKNKTTAKKNIVKKVIPKKTSSRLKKIIKSEINKEELVVKDYKSWGSGPYLSVIIPAFNEAKRIPLTLIDVDRILKDMDFDYEIVVVDDGSSDNTVLVVKKFADVIPYLRVIENLENHGKGYVVRQGMIEAKGEIRLFMDADNSTTVDQFLLMKNYFDKGASVVIGSRALKESELSPPQAWYKQIAGKMGNLFIQIVALPGIWDTQCGFKAFNRRAAMDIFERAEINRWAFDVEALLLAKKLGYEIEMIPVYWVNDIYSHVKLSSYIQVLFETVKIALRLRKGVKDSLG